MLLEKVQSRYLLMALWLAIGSLILAAPSRAAEAGLRVLTATPALAKPAQILFLRKPAAEEYEPLPSTKIDALRGIGASRVEDHGPYVYVTTHRAAAIDSIERAGGLKATPLPHAFDVELGAAVRDVREPWPPVEAADELTVEDYSPGGSGLYLVKLATPPKAEWFDRLGLAGIRTVQYVSWNAWIVAAPAGLSSLANRLAADAIHLEPLQPWDKLESNLRSAEDGSSRAMSLLFDGGQGDGGLRKALASIDPDATVSIDGWGDGHADFVGSAVDARGLARRPETIWIQVRSIGEPSDERAAQVAVGNYSNNLPTGPGQYKAWLDGLCNGCLSATNLAYETVSIFDTGLSEYSGAPGTRAHEDLDGAGNDSRRAYPSFGCCGLEGAHTNDITYHGTVVTGLIAGDPQQNPPPPGGLGGLVDAGGFYLGTGVAPGVRFGMTRMAYTGGLGSQVSALTLSGATLRVFDSGAAYQNNSWNFGPVDPQSAPPSDAAYSYDSVARQYDVLVRDARVGSGTEATWRNPMTIVFSAGNIRQNDNLYSFVRSPATAKNIISVGAAGLPRSGLQATGCVDSQISIRDVALLSRRGVALSSSTRFKPDLVAPGWTTVSTRSYSGATADCASSGGQVQYEPSAGGGYLAERGTSFSAPQVTGAAVLVKKFLQWSGVSGPQPALIKATLLGAADSMQGGHDYATGAGLGWEPGLAQGFGRLSLGKLLSDPTGKRYLNEDHGTLPTRRFRASGGYKNVSYTVADPSKPIIVTLAYTDAPSAAGTSGSRVNGIDLYVLQGGSIYCDGVYGNQYTPRSSGCWLPDMANNVKQIRIAPNSFSGSFTVQVVANGINANAVPQRDGGAPNQDWALFVYNAN